MRTPSRHTAVGAAVTAVAAAALALPAASSAASAGGTTELRLASKAAAALGSAGITVTPVRTTPLPSGAIPFPVTGVRGGISSITHSGGLRLRRAGKSLTLTDFRILMRGGKPTAIRAKVGKATVTAFRLTTPKLETTTDGLDTRISGVSVRLSTTGAAAIRSRLGVRLPAGYRLASARVTLQEAATRVTLDTGTAGVLDSLGVSVAPEGDAVAGSSAIQFPITTPGGRIALDRHITHSGGLTFSAAGTELTVGDFTIEAGTGLLYAERSPLGRIPLLRADLGDADVSTPGIRVRVAGAKLSLTPEAAAALNATFGVTAFTAGLPIGTAEVVGRS